MSERYPLSIKDWPTNEQPRSKFLNLGPDSLSDAELLAIFLHSGTKGKSAVDLARELIVKFSSLRGLLECSKHEFCQIEGLGIARYVLLQAVLEMGRRHLFQQLKSNPIVKNSNRMKDFLLAELRHLKQEVLAGVFLDNACRVIHYDVLARGTLSETSVYPREIIKDCLKHNAAALVLAHNHPSGVTQPSAADLHLTENIQQSLKVIDVSLIDHVIVGDGQTFSFAEQGLIKKIDDSDS